MRGLVPSSSWRLGATVQRVKAVAVAAGFRRIVTEMGWKGLNGMLFSFPTMISEPNCGRVLTLIGEGHRSPKAASNIVSHL